MRSASAAVQRTVQDLTAGWRFKLGDLPYSRMVRHNSARTKHTQLPIRSTLLAKRVIWALEIGGRGSRAGGATTCQMIVLGPVAPTPIAPCGAGTITLVKDPRLDLTCRQPHTETATLVLASMMWQQSAPHRRRSWAVHGPCPRLNLIHHGPPCQQGREPKQAGLMTAVGGK